MKPVQGLQNLKFGGGVSETILHPAVLAVIIIAGILIIVLPRKKALSVFLAAGLLIPVDQILLVGSAHFPMLRILVFFGMFRALKEKTTNRARLLSERKNSIDVAVILMAGMIAFNGIVLFEVWGAVINQLGELYTIFGMYFTFRSFIRNEEDVTSAIRTLSFVAAFVATVMAYEIATGHNPYAVLGGAAASKYATLVAREDRFRAQGPFAHSILAGTFGAVLFPVFVALWQRSGKYHKIAALGMFSATVITASCNSSTPVLAYAAGLLALCMWPLRNHMRVIRWAIVATLVSLHLVMKNPVWHLITRIDISGGSSSWHRFMLIDQCIRHFGDWWLIGVKDTSVWGWDMWDTANQYVATCDNSGLIPFLLFIAVLVYGFKYLGHARRAAAADRSRALFIWALGSALFANVVAFVGISYFDQTQVAWYALLAMISAVVIAPAKRRLKQTPAEPQFLEASSV